MNKAWVVLAVAFSMAAAFAIRVVPAYAKVFRADGVSFQENDAYFHLRTVHNQIAHFPRRSGFDPYAVYPRGQDIPTGPVWDWMISSVAWAVGRGTPSDELADGVGAWVPAALGALFPLVAFFLANTLAGEAAGMFAAWCTALVPGGFLWLTHLGLTDHHVAESFFALLTLAAICSAVAAAGEGRVRRACWLTLLGGVSLGGLLGTRPIGAFVIAIFLLTAIVPDVELAAVTLGVLAIAALLFVPVGTLQWSNYTWLLLIAGMAAMAAAWMLDHWRRRKGWPWVTGPLLMSLVGAIALIAGLTLRGALLRSLWRNVARTLGVVSDSGTEATVRELRPLIDFGTPTLGGLTSELGTIWIIAIPALAWIVIHAFRVRKPAWTLFAAWALVIVVAGFAQFRMIVYAAPILASAGGMGLAGLLGYLPARLRLGSGLLAAAVIGITNLPFGVAQVQADGGPTPGRVAAMEWIRHNTPEPFGDPAAYRRYYARRWGAPFPYPDSAYSIAVWWDFGYLLENRGRRIPSSNGTQAGASETAYFYSETDPKRGLDELRAIGSRYVLVDATQVSFGFGTPTSFDAITRWAARPVTAYYRTVYSEEGGRLTPTILYLPDYFRSMAVRMYLFDANAATARSAWVLSTGFKDVPGIGQAEVIQWERQFNSEKDARAFIANAMEAEGSVQRLTLASFDTAETCVDLDPMPGLRLAFNSDPGPIRHDRPVRAIKVFEVSR